MPQSLYARTAARGFPVQDIAGQTGVGHLQDKTRLPERAGVADATWAEAEARQHANYAPAVLAPPEEYVLGQSLWGLPAERSPDTTPHGVEYHSRQAGDIGPGLPHAAAVTHDDPYPQGPYHDAPLIDPGLAVEGLEVGKAGKWRAYLEADVAFNAPDTSEEIINPGGGMEGLDGKSLVGFQGIMKQDHVGPHESTDTVLQERVSGQMRGNANAGLDSVQGYGGGGKGPGGTNLPELTYDQRNYPGKFYAHDAFTQAGEVPHIDAETAQFIQSQPGQAPWTGDMWAAPLTRTHAQAITPADVPLQGPPVGSADYGVQPLWGVTVG